ncbi:hypothetical protein ABID70_001802 [Clavibacter michiganensis]
MSTETPASVESAATRRSARICAPWMVRRWRSANSSVGRDLERRGLGRDDVHERPALLAREHGRVELLGERGVAAEDDAGPGARQGLVHGGGDHVRVRDRRGVDARGDEAREVRHVDPELGADLVGDRAERGEVEVAGVRRPAGDDDLRAVLERLLAHDVHVDEEGVGIHAVGGRVVELPGEVELHAVREVAAVRELEAEDRVARLRDGGEDGSVRGGARVRLDVGELGAEEALGAVDGELLRDVDELAAAVVAAARVALRVLVGEHGSLRLQHRARHEVLAGDHLEGAALTPELLLEDGRDLRVDLGEGGVEGLVDGHGTP